MFTSQEGFGIPWFIIAANKQYAQLTQPADGCQETSEKLNQKSTLELWSCLVHHLVNGHSTCSSWPRFPLKMDTPGFWPRSLPTTRQFISPYESRCVHFSLVVELPAAWEATCPVRFSVILLSMLVGRKPSSFQLAVGIIFTTQSWGVVIDPQQYPYALHPQKWSCWPCSSVPPLMN